MSQVKKERILSSDLIRCPNCHRLRGCVEEKYNGKVMVDCRCGTPDKPKAWRVGDDGETRLISPLIVSDSNDRFWWCPTTDHREEDGKWWHTPYFDEVGD